MHASAAQRVYEHVKTGILDATYPAGDLLTEGVVSERVGVSRTPVREALLRLEAEGLLRLYPKKGALVVPVSAREAEDVLEARALVEQYAAPRAWARRETLADDLQPLVDAMREHRDRGDMVEFNRADRSFHERIVTAAGNEVLARLYRSLRERQLCISGEVLRVSAERMDQALADHQLLVDLLRGDDERAFVALTDSHLHRALEQSRGVR
ncbi:MAG: GntR family transcriptional regulator [Actinomycetota bacterium]|nr:GntR family transcriptional regulator [Actinomycetota bacterium]